MRNWFGTEIWDWGRNTSRNVEERNWFEFCWAEKERKWERIALKKSMNRRTTIVCKFTKLQTKVFMTTIHPWQVLFGIYPWRRITRTLSPNCEFSKNWFTILYSLPQFGNILCARPGKRLKRVQSGTIGVSLPLYDTHHPWVSEYWPNKFTLSAETFCRPGKKGSGGLEQMVSVQGRVPNKFLLSSSHIVSVWLVGYCLN